MLDKTARVSRFKPLPILTINLAKILAWLISFIKAPLPKVTSNKIASVPAANFLDITEAAINGMDSTVPVTSLRAYIFLSAGTKDWV